MVPTRANRQHPDQVADFGQQRTKEGAQLSAQDERRPRDSAQGNPISASSRTSGVSQQPQQQQQQQSVANNYISSLVNKSSSLLHSLKQQYFSPPMEPPEESARPEALASGPAQAAPRRPKPPLPPRGFQQKQQQQSHSVPVSSANSNNSSSSGGTCESVSPAQPPQERRPASPARRHALQEQSLERDAALSLKARELKHKRTASIKSALRHAHLGPLRPGASKRAGERTANAESCVSMPYELFEPPVTQRTFQRTRRRGAMLADPKRQMSVDTIGLRQLTDEYLRNAGVKPEGPCSLVALSSSPAGSSSCPLGAAAAQGVARAGGSGGLGTAAPAAVAMQPQFSIETQLYQASHAAVIESRPAHSTAGWAGAAHESGSLDSMSQVTILPGNLPWQSDVCIQCELIRAPPMLEPYETTGDILNTIAGPFRGARPPEVVDSSSVSATLRRGLTAISQHHLSPGCVAPGSALQVVGSLKKSLSNTLDISMASARNAHLHSQDSLPAYASLQNEEEEEEEPVDAEAGLIGHLASKLARQSSKKTFSVARRKGLHRALSFDCRGYKRLEAQQRQTESSNSMHQRTSSNLLSTGQQMHNKSTLGLATRPYLPQSASQVDFQLPLLPYHKMQEAIVSQRLLEPLPSAAAGNETPGQKLDADQLICGPSNQEQADRSQETTSASQSRDAAIATTVEAHSASDTSKCPQLEPSEEQENDLADENDDGGEEATTRDDSQRHAHQSVPASPNIVALDPAGFNLPISQSPSFCLAQATGAERGAAGANVDSLTANDVFARAGCLIKRPSTMVASDAMNQVAQALQLSGGSDSGALRNRRQAIVPPKLATDASQSDTEGEQPAVGQLVELSDDEAPPGRLDFEDEATVRALRRKRSGGGGTMATVDSAPQQQSKQQQVVATRNGARRLSGSPTTLPTFFIEPDPPSCDKLDRSDSASQLQRRPDSQATNADSVALSGSSLSISGKRDFAVTSPGGLTVSFGSSRGRRRSSIAVIPQMQICPGDLLVYSKQLIDRMNQSDEPPDFLTVEDKKGKNIWSSFKLCAQFDNRTSKARNELLCSLEDVLASLQPSTFIDEQLSHYKGMLWEEFLFETESRRSASSEQLSLQMNSDDLCKPLELKRPAETSSEAASPEKLQLESKRESLGLSLSAAERAGGAVSPSTGSTPQHRSRDQAVRSISSRFREKPKLKRGQTVDSVFRIPLIPSSPLKHAQQHQQTPTAHLEDLELLTIEDDERSSPSQTSADSNNPMRESSFVRKNRSASTRSRSGSQRRAKASAETDQILAAKQQVGTRMAISQSNGKLDGQQLDSSFETDDAMDLIGGSSQVHGQSRTMARQSSLSTLSSTITRTEQKRQRALWDLFQSECTFFFDHLMTLKNVYMEPLKKIQVEGFAMFADPDVLFGNLDELCCGVYDFCKEFLYIIMRTLKTRPEELNATDVLIKLYKKNPKIDHLRGVYHRYTLNYINALNYLDNLRRQVEFVEFEKWSSRDVRCKKLQLTDLLVAPVQHIMRVPIILKDIESHTENTRDRDEIRAILAVEEASLRELDDKMRWLKNFERLLEIQKNISWPSILELDAKLFIPEFLKDALAKQPCEKLIVSPRRQIVHEGTLSNLDVGKACDMHVILFDDMLLLTRRKKGLAKKASTVCKTNSGGTLAKDDGSFKYIVYKQPLSLDRFHVHDVQQADAQSIGMKNLLLILVMNRFQQITNVHSFSAPNDDIKQTWLYKIKKTCERWKKNLSSNPADQQPQQMPIVQTASSQPTNSNQQQMPSAHKVDPPQEQHEAPANNGEPKVEGQSRQANKTTCIRAEQNNNGQQTIELIVTKPPSTSPEHSAAASTASAH